METKPREVKVGQRWECVRAGCKTPTGFEIRRPVSGGGWEAYWDDGIFGYWTSGEAILTECKYIGGPAETPPAPSTPVMGEREEYGAKWPVGCLVCSQKLRTGQAYVCDEHEGDYGRWDKFADAWDAGARDFPRREAKPAAQQFPSPAPNATAPVADATRPALRHENLGTTSGETPAKSGRESLSSPSVPSVSKPAAIANVPPPRPLVPPPAPPPYFPTGTKREVSTDGKHWVNFDRLTDGDAFEAYPWRKVYFGEVAGVTEPQQPRGYGNLTFAEHAFNDINKRMHTNDRDKRKRASAGDERSETTQHKEFTEHHYHHGVTNASRAYWPRSLPDMDVSK